MVLTFDSYLGIAGFVVGVIGAVYGVKSDQKLKTAQEAEKQIEKKFMHYMAAQEFEELAKKAAGIMGNIRRREWALVTRLADDIGPSLGQARGARTEVDLSSQPSGVYFLTIRTAGQVIERRVIKE